MSEVRNVQVKRERLRETEENSGIFYSVIPQTKRRKSLQISIRIERYCLMLYMVL